MNKNDSLQSFGFCLKASSLWNGFFLFRIVLYVMLMTELSPVLFLTGFVCSLVHHARRAANRILRSVFMLFNLSLLYHDSYLPGIRQLFAQRSNLKDFSLDYVSEFLVDFINLHLLLALVAIIVVLKLASYFVRGSAVVLISFLIVFITPVQKLQIFSFKTDEITLNHRFLNSKAGKIVQSGTFTDANLNRYLETFYDN